MDKATTKQKSSNGKPPRKKQKREGAFVININTYFKLLTLFSTGGTILRVVAANTDSETANPTAPAPSGSKVATITP